MVQPTAPPLDGAPGQVQGSDTPIAASQANLPAGPLSQEEPATTAITPVPPRRLDDVRAEDIARETRGGASIEAKREDVREYLARTLIRMLGFTIFLAVALIATRRWTHVSEDETRMFFQVVFTAVIALVSAATGFYFGSDRRDPPDGD
ncbi:hypothetical protein BH11ACT8_BH11ACT8_01850 [soil metagenome]